MLVVLEVAHHVHFCLCVSVVPQGRPIVIIRFEAVQHLSSPGGSVCRIGKVIAEQKVRMSGRVNGLEKAAHRL